MTRPEYFIWLIKQAFGPPFVWPVIVALSSGTLAILLRKNPFANGQSRSHWCSLSPFLLTLLIFVMGTVFQHEQGNHVALPLFALYVLAFAHLPVAALLIWRLKTIRWFTASVNVLVMWMSFWAWFVAVMSISGDWL